MIRILSLIILLNFSIFQAQSRSSETLPSVQNRVIQHSEILQFRNLFSESATISDKGKLKNSAQNNLTIARNSGKKIDEAIQLLNLGKIYFLSGNNDEAEKSLLLSEEILQHLKQKDDDVQKTLGEVLSCKAVVLSSQNNYKEALRSYSQAIEIYKEEENNIQISKIYSNLGIIYQSINDDDKALNYFLKSYEIQKENESPLLAVTCSQIGKTYLNLDNSQNAKKFFDEGLKEFGKAKDKNGLGELYNNISQYYVSLKQPEIAKNYISKAETEFKKQKDLFGLSDIYLLLAKIYFDENNLDLSSKYANESVELAKELNLSENEMGNEKILYEIYFRKGDQLNALIHLRNYDIAKEKLLKIENSKERMRAELDFEDEKEILKQEALANRGKLIAVFGILILAALLFGAFLHYRNIQQRKSILLQKQLVEYEHKALHLQMNPHFMYNCLAAISSFIMQNGKDEAVKYLAKFSKLMRLTLEFSKESSIPIDQEILSLQNYLELEQLRFNRKFDFKIIKDPAIEDDTAIPSLLLQPYVENAVIHGVVPKEDQGLIEVRFSQKEDILLCEIEDNGIGIETSKKMKEGSVRAHKSMALEISQKRIETMEKLEKKKVPLTIKEQKDENGNIKGTKITLEFPLEYIAH